jgi:redox-sensitive bicupin YhaK (pirin superfamily)
VRLLQAWIDPDAAGVEPASAHARFDAAAKRSRLCLIASPDGREGSLAIRQDVLVHAGLFAGAEHARLAIGPGRGAYVYVARGKLGVNGEALGEGDALLAHAGEVSLEAGEGGEVLIFDLPV